MKISRIYLKIFLAFMLVLVVSELIVIGVIKSLWAQSPRVNHMERQIMTVKNLAELELGSTHISAEHEKKVLTPLLKTLAKSLQAEVWITGPYGEVVASSSIQVPDMKEYVAGEAAKSHEGAYVYKKKHGSLKSVYGVYTADLPKGYPFTYHLFLTFPKFNEEIWFLRAQALLTILAAIFLIPVARRMIKPINKLTDSASKMGQGDLKQRVEIKGKDEIAKLGKTFNHMAESLEKIIKSSRELTANVSHELRSPLTRMRISLEMVKEKIESGNTKGCDTFIIGMQAEITHMDELIGKIIEFSKLDMQKNPALTETADLKGLISDLLAQYEHIASHNKMTVSTDLEELRLSGCNRNGIKIILDNILGNAFKYTEQHGKISVKLSSDKKTAKIEVTNSHAPLPEDGLEEIFNPFHRLKGHEIPGSGLGLAAAQKIAQIHGGLLKAENSEEGFRIVVELPLISA
ncbi:sensor histidine kinase [Maridesulfovibrio hydrothermalis]|uniref:histidine kinase n=1 Tax=Maridesulfovibrio hydrothermalis AM13 = DSM 14728 TaxID=1121451 RepID=L0RC93_9BACT|nr:HAMP domain-containing sensor histidine kinase [Maridesulfovibrio hydrothermalis]CCO23837.1 Histidine kinase [Maridesulfovibrio hydrothermalis AM13 = DSM 14728]